MTEKQFRLRLVLGKYRVVNIEAGNVAVIQLGGTTQMRVPIPERADIRLGDILTLYTEVLTKDTPYAPSVFTRQ